LSRAVIGTPFQSYGMSLAVTIMWQCITVFLA